jgi:integrase
MASIEFKYLVKDTDRYGTDRYYVRINGRKRRIRGEPPGPEFVAAYHAARAELEAGQGEAAERKTIRPASLEWLGREYFASGIFRQLDARSQRLRRNILEACFAEPIAPASKARMGDCPLAAFGSRHVETLRDRKLTTPGAANNRLKYLGAMFSWAVKSKRWTYNPVAGVESLRYASDGFHSWSDEERAKFEAHWPIGTKPRLAYALLLYTGARRGDVVTLGRQHMRNGVIAFVPEKTKRLRADPVFVEIVEPLRTAIEAGPAGNMTFLLTEYGAPFSAAGFGNWFGEKCAEAGLPHCSAHGLRKAGATIAADGGASERQLMALYGWTTLGQASTYVRRANSKRLASGAVRLIGERPGNKLSHRMGRMLSHRTEQTDFIVLFLELAGVEVILISPTNQRDGRGPPVTARSLTRKGFPRDWPTNLRRADRKKKPPRKLRSPAAVNPM